MLRSRDGRSWARQKGVAPGRRRRMRCSPIFTHLGHGAAMVSRGRPLSTVRTPGAARRRLQAALAACPGPAVPLVQGGAAAGRVVYRTRNSTETGGEAAWGRYSLSTRWEGPLGRAPDVWTNAVDASRP